MTNRSKNLRWTSHRHRWLRRTESRTMSSLLLTWLKVLALIVIVMVDIRSCYAFPFMGNGGGGSVSGVKYNNGRSSSSSATKFGDGVGSSMVSAGVGTKTTTTTSTSSSSTSSVSMSLSSSSTGSMRSCTTTATTVATRYGRNGFKVAIPSVPEYCASIRPLVPTLCSVLTTSRGGGGGGNGGGGGGNNAMPPLFGSSSRDNNSNTAQVDVDVEDAAVGKGGGGTVVGVVNDSEDSVSSSLSTANIIRAETVSTRNENNKIAVKGGEENRNNVDAKDRNDDDDDYTRTITRTSKKTRVLTSSEQFIKSEPDKRDYRTILLPNNLEVLLASDPKTDIEAGAVHLRTGHFSDFVNRPGLAHFHEHMLFLGTEKYPNENDYESFLNKNGGSSNAYTDMEDTNYYFSVAPLSHDEDINNDEGDNNYDEGEEEGDDDNMENQNENDDVSAALYGALDRFAQFFISPNFQSNMIERELRAVDSEYSNALTSDAWRSYQLLKHGSNPKHPFHKFGCGNYETLTNGGCIHGANSTFLANIPFHGGSNPREDLIDFWEQNYHASNMKLVVLGRSSLDSLQKVVEDIFGDVRSQGTKGKVALDEENENENENESENESESESEGFKSEGFKSEKDGTIMGVVNGEKEIENTRPDDGDNILFDSEHSKYDGVIAFGRNELGIIREVIPVKERRQVKIQFAVPPSEDELMEKYMPQRLISHLLGHESPRSLHHLLNELGYINALSSGTSVDTSDFALFGVTISLTPLGLANLDEVLDLTFQWIHLIQSTLYDDDKDNDEVEEEEQSEGIINGGGGVQQEGLMKHYHEELLQMARISFRYRENGDPTSFCSSAAELLFTHSNSSERILAGNGLFAEYNSTVTKAFMDRLHPRNAIISIFAPDSHDENDYDGGNNNETATTLNMERWGRKNGVEVSARAGKWEKESWYGAEYRQVPIPVDLVEKWTHPTYLDAELNLPPLNQFISTDFSLRCDDGHDNNINDNETESEKTIHDGQENTDLKNNDDFNGLDQPPIMHHSMEGSPLMTDGGAKGGIDESSSTLLESVVSTIASPQVAEDEMIKVVSPPTLLSPSDTFTTRSRTHFHHRAWHKLDSKFRVPKTTMNVHITSPLVYSSPRSMTYCRLFQKVLNDDLNSFVYDASLAGCTYRVTVTPTGFDFSVSGYSDKMPILLDVLTSRIMSLMDEMKKKKEKKTTDKMEEGFERPSSLESKFRKAVINLKRETLNFKLDSPLDIAAYNSRMLLEESVWHIDEYVAVLNGGVGGEDEEDRDELTMEECAHLVEECLSGRVKVESLCMGNVDEKGASAIARTLEQRLFSNNKPRLLSENEKPIFKSLQLPTMEEAKVIFGGGGGGGGGSSVAFVQKDIEDDKARDSNVIPVIVEDLAFSEKEENHAVEISIQLPPDNKLGYKGVALLQLIAHMAYPSFYNQLRTKEQLGYIVSTYIRRTAGQIQYMVMEVQSNTKLPQELEQRCLLWLRQFRNELLNMDPERIAMEASAVVAQLLERDVKLSDETTRSWAAIRATEQLNEHNNQPVFDRLERLASILSLSGEEIDVDEQIQDLDGKNDNNKISFDDAGGAKNAIELKQEVINFFDAYLSPDYSNEWRVLSSRVYGHGQNGKHAYEENKEKKGNNMMKNILSNYENDVQKFKQYLHALPIIPYWR